jgi:uncharacterized protein (DUF305 family)
MRIHTRTLVVAAALAGALVLMGWGGSGQQPVAAVSGSHPSPTASSPPGSFNDADVTFAQQMIQHHRQAMQMARMAPSHTQNPKVSDLAAKIEAGQAPEIQTMTAWLHTWGKPVPTGIPERMPPMPSMTGSPGQGLRSSPMPGMTSRQEMSHLMADHGAHFDYMFLQTMIGHYQGAVEMARTEQSQGVNPAARNLARQIATSQTAEIAQMQQLLRQ